MDRAHFETARVYYGVVRNTGLGSAANSEPGRPGYVTQASSPASSGSVPLPVPVAALRCGRRACNLCF